MWCEGGKQSVFQGNHNWGVVRATRGCGTRVASGTGDYCRHQECKNSFVWEEGNKTSSN